MERISRLSFRRKKNKQRHTHLEVDVPSDGGSDVSVEERQDVKYIR